MLSECVKRKLACCTANVLRPEGRGIMAKRPADPTNAGVPAARVGDLLTCCGPPDTIAMGSATVMIAGAPAARVGDLTAHGGSIVVGCPTVGIGG